MSATTALPVDGGSAVGEGAGADGEPLLPPQPLAAARGAAAASGAAAARPRNRRRRQGWVSPGAVAARGVCGHRLCPSGGPEITIEGVYAGHELFLQLLAEPPEDEEPGMELDATRSLVTGGSTDPEDVH